MKHSHISAAFQACTVALQAFLGSCLKMSYIIGSKAAFFSSAVIVEPLVGFWAPLPITLIYYSLRVACAYFLFQSITPLLIAYHIPSFCASFYFAAKKSSSISTKIIYALLPLSCMILFVTHSVGMQIWWYSLLWLIPLIDLWAPQTHFFVHALGATFTSHAVGTILWLSMHTTTVAFWYGLLPVVIVERVVFAVSMTLLNNVIAQSAHKISQLSLSVVQPTGKASCM